MKLIYFLTHFGQQWLSSSPLSWKFNSVSITLFVAFLKLKNFNAGLHIDLILAPDSRFTQLLSEAEFFCPKMQMWEYACFGGTSVETGWFLSKPDITPVSLLLHLTPRTGDRDSQDSTICYGLPLVQKAWNEIAQVDSWPALRSSPVTGETEIGRFVLKDD